MLTLLLLRHAKAEPAAREIEDIDRSLAARGRTDAPRLGAAIAARGLIPDLIVCSPARRTRETLELVVAAFDAVIATRFEPAIYEATFDRLLRVVRSAPPSAHRVMLVGHNPGFEDLANHLTGTADPIAAARLEAKYPTGGLAVLTFQASVWPDVCGRSGTLSAFIAPRFLDGS